MVRLHDRRWLTLQSASREVGSFDGEIGVDGEYNPDSGFDCSGLVGYVFRSALGIELPRVSREMAHDDNAELINDRTALAAGDLVFFGRKGRVDHVGIYVGDGRFLHAPSSGKDVRVDTLLSGYWGNKFMQARRVDL